MDRATLTRRSLLVGAAAIAVGVAGGSSRALAIQPATGPRVALPEFAYYSAEALRAYRVALVRPDLLAKLPCYCGCGLMQPPHLTLHDCFVRPDGSFVPHAAGCSVCQEEALDADRWAAEGATPAEVRRRIDERYRERGPAPPSFDKES